MKVTCGLIIDDSKILVAQRGNLGSNAGKWEFPGGKVKKNEIFEDCLKRELKEELNIQVNIISSYEHVKYMYPDFEIELIPFLCKIKAGEIILREHAQLKWCDLDDIEQLDFSDADKIIVKRIKKAGKLPALGNSDKN